MEKNRNAICGEQSEARTSVGWMRRTEEAWKRTQGVEGEEQWQTGKRTIRGGEEVEDDKSNDDERVARREKEVHVCRRANKHGGRGEKYDGKEQVGREEVVV